MNLKRLTFVVLLIALCSIGLIFNKRSLPKIKSQGGNSTKNQEQPKKATSNKYKQSIFVPYWQLDGRTQELGDENQKYDRYIYFGVAGTEEGIPTDDPGYEHLDGFMGMANGPRWLTVRMTDSEVNDRVLGSKASQMKIVADAIRIAKEYGFEGLVLDFEYGSLFGGRIDDTTTFYKLFGDKTKLENLKFAVALYGDVFYRNRPYNVAEIAKNADEVMIMAYDLHKSRGEPGPNFPLKAGKTYGYGYDLLLKDIEKLVPTEKLTVIFGMYGYDWKVDEQKRPITQGTSRTTAQILKDYIDMCDSLHCTQLVDPVSAETEIDYIGDDGRYHIIWFEDTESTKKKTKFLNLKGVDSVAYWAYGYF